jgi:hypothetical protein
MSITRRTTLALAAAAALASPSVALVQAKGEH